MQVNAEIMNTRVDTHNSIIKKFGLIVNSNKSALDTNQYSDLINMVKELAEHKNYVEAQYYLARYFLRLNDINNYKFWLMRAAKNSNPHPLANLKIIKYCLQQYKELRNKQPEQSSKRLAMAKEHLYFIMQFNCHDIFKRIDWLYAKEQAQKIWENEICFNNNAEIWLAPAEVKQDLDKIYYRRYSALGLHAKKLGAKIKKLLGRYN